jgi:type III restriction enzyme
MNPDQAMAAISARLSLRAPQKESLQLLARAAEVLPLVKDQDLDECLKAITALSPSVTNFERDFPSLCFALATGVGKTRLMGAFIAYLAKIRGLKHYFVLAPNLTIYNKLVEEFRNPNHPKYVFRGLPEFASNPPEVITGDDYDSGRMFRGYDDSLYINVFNISKINSEVRGGSSPRIRKLSEYLGTSYFDYLSSREDLVLLMDESHRYRATQGAKAINELKPILGLELTATPRTSSPAAEFKNVIYSYPLSAAMADGFVKEPAVVTKENFIVSEYSDDELERVKMEDGIRVHEHTKVELETYSRQTGKPLVRPFMMVVAQDIEHAGAVEQLIKSPEFFEGRYAGKVITVHSQQSGELKDEMVARLLAVEQTHDEKAPEIVIHVNKLGEGWDVTNLYTIVPLRRFAAQILTEQTLGRGLRLPYGQKTGVKSVDTLHVVAHDKFQEIIDAARLPNSLIREQVVIGRDIPLGPIRPVTVKPNLTPTVATPGVAAKQGALVFESQEEADVSVAALKIIQQHSYLPASEALKLPEVKQLLAHELQAAYNAVEQPALEGADVKPPVDIQKVLEKTIEAHISKTIDVPLILLKPKDVVRVTFLDFELDVAGIHNQPVATNLIVEELRTENRWKLRNDDVMSLPEPIEGILVDLVKVKSDVDYSANSTLLYKLAGQMVAHLRSYLSNEEDVRNVLINQRRPYSELIYAQMQQHKRVSEVEYEAVVKKGFIQLKDLNFGEPISETPRHFTLPLEIKSKIREQSFCGFTKCLYDIQKFQSNPERVMSVILERDPSVIKWMKPVTGQLPIRWKGGDYDPDFIVECDDFKLLIEPKRRDQIETREVQAKALSAFTWTTHASEHARENGAKPWKYLLVPDDAITEAMTVQGLISKFEYRPKGV